MKTARASASPCCAAAAGCGSGSSTPKTPTIQPARTFQLAGFEPTGQGAAGQADDGLVHDRAAERDSR